MNRKKLLITFDAFGTLFSPKESIAKQYVEVARRHGLGSLDPEDISWSFRKAFGTERKLHPNHGKDSGMEASEWWANVIKATFQPFSTSLPDRLIPDLLKRFSSSEGYRLDPSVASLFDMIREANVQSRTDGKKPWPWDYTVVGIITNSDDRIPSILSSLGLKVGGKRYGAANEQAEDACKDNDISFLVLSYDVGVEKPDAKIFDAAKELLKTSLGGDNQNCRTVGSRAPIEEKHRVDEFELLHVGDDEKQDVLGALNAGWNSVLLDRNGRHSRNFREEEGKYISSVELASAPRRVKVIQDLKALRFWRAP